MKKRDKSFDFMIEKTPTISESDIDYFQEHPEELDNIIDKEILHIQFLKFFGVAALLIILLARTLGYLFKDQLGEFVNHVILDVISEFGIALLGGVVTVLFLEILQKKQYEENVRYRKEVLAKIKQREQSSDKFDASQKNSQ